MTLTNLKPHCRRSLDLTAIQHKQAFDNASRRTDETWKQYKSR